MHLHIISRSTAKDRGLRHYFPGILCPSGHADLRLTSNKKCIACHRERAAILRARPGAKEVRSDYDRKRWEELKGEIGPRNRARYEKNKEAINKKKKDYYAKNRERLSAARKLWLKENKARILHLNALRKKRVKRATPLWADRALILDVYRLAERLTLETGIPHHVDHIVPIAGQNVCGLHVHYNLRPLPWVDNLRKKNSFVDVS